MSKGNQIQNQKLELIHWLSSIEDSKLIEAIIALKDKAEQDWWNELNEVEKQSIEKGLKDANKGKLIDHAEARKHYEKWL